MDIRRWSGSSKDMIQLGRPARDDEISVLRLSRCFGQSKRACWRAVWKRLVNERRRIFGSKVQAVQRRLLQRRPYYDASSYAQNFDEGRLWDEDEPDIRSRSFSMRFAGPSRVQFHKREVKLLDL